MPVPDRTAAASFLLSLDPPTWFLRHARAVAEVASWLARAVAAHEPCDRAAVEAAALLHDADKALAPADPLRSLPHGRGSAAWLEARGLPELGPLVADHPVTRLVEDGWEGWLAAAPTEALIVAYADKRAGQRLEPMAARFAGWARRHDDDRGWPKAVRDRAWARALVLEERVCRAAACSPADVRRVRWTSMALHRAQRLRQAA